MTETAASGCGKELPWLSNSIIPSLTVHTNHTLSHQSHLRFFSESIADSQRHAKPTPLFQNLRQNTKMAGRSAMPRVLAAVGAAGVGYYLYQAGGNPKVAEKKFERAYSETYNRNTCSLSCRRCRTPLVLGEERSAWQGEGSEDGTQGSRIRSRRQVRLGGKRTCWIYTRRDLANTIHSSVRPRPRLVNSIPRSASTHRTPRRSLTT